MKKKFISILENKNKISRSQVIAKTKLSAFGDTKNSNFNLASAHKFSSSNTHNFGQHPNKGSKRIFIL